jgi:hypothetical protein
VGPTCQGEKEREEEAGARRACLGRKGAAAAGRKEGGEWAAWAGWGGKGRKVRFVFFLLFSKPFQHKTFTPF